MYFKHISARFFHLTRQNLASEKSALATLRKKTGYTFANCKKALEANQNDLAKAEAWLKEQATAMGWSKAVKLEGRSTTQGLVGIVVKNNIGAMVEVNCETDFVARNDKFQQFVEQASIACVDYISEVDATDKITKIGLESDALKNLKTSDGKSLADSLALMIGTVGENASMKRAICYKAPQAVSISAHIHPSPDTYVDGKVFFGKYGAIAAFNSNAEKSEAIQSIHRKICQHIVGVKPEKIGDAENDKPNEDKDEEKCLIFQEYILDPDLTIGEILKENNIKIIDFQRFEVGEKYENFGSEK